MKKSSRAVSFSVVLCLLFALLPVLPASAAKSAMLSVSSTQLSPGDTVTVTVGFSSDESLVGADVTVEYPPSVFSYVGHSFGENTAGTPRENNRPTNNSIQFKYWLRDGNTTMTLGTITLKVKASPASKGDIVVTKAEGSRKDGGKWCKLNTDSVTVSTKKEQPPEPSQPEKQHSNLLSSLTVSNAELAPAFDPEHPAESYACTVPYEVEALDIKAVAADPEASISIQNNKLKASGVTNVTVVVVPAPGSGLERRSYTILATREAPLKAPALDALEVVGEPLTPAFAPDVLEYQCQVSHQTEALDVNAVCSDPDAIVELSDLSLAQSGATAITVTVSKEGCTPRVYTVSVTRRDAHSSRLQSLSVTEAPFSPSFEQQKEPGSLYACTVPYEADSLHITAVPEDSAASIRIENNTLIPGSTSRVTITVSCQDQEDSVYYIDATREAQPSADGQEEADSSGAAPFDFSKLAAALAVIIVGGAAGFAVFLLYLKRNPMK